MRHVSHLTPRYLLDRMHTMWYQWRHPDHPWLTATAIGIIDSWLRPTDVGFEWGAGRSTLWFAGQVQHLTSIEYDEKWYFRVKGMLAAADSRNVDLRMLPLDGGANSLYVRSIKEFAPGSLDFVLVDGRLRHYCTLAALSRIKPGGLLIFDNANLDLPNSSPSPGSLKGKPIGEWQTVASQLANWRSIWTSNGVSDTALFIKGTDSKTRNGVTA